VPADIREALEVGFRGVHAWDLLGDASSDGPLDERTRRLIKLGITSAELHQVVALAASIIEGAVHEAMNRCHSERSEESKNNGRGAKAPHLYLIDSSSLRSSE
jgi:hypothetical protein